MNSVEAKVVFMPSGRRGLFSLGTPLLQAARSLGVDIDSVCGGRGLCGRCQILCSEGDFPKHEIVSRSSHLSSFSETEQRYCERKKQLKPGHRLSCHTTILGDLIIDVPAESQVHRQVIRKQAEQRDIILNASVHLYYVEVQKAEMQDARGDLQRLKQALAEEWHLEDLDFDISIIDYLQPSLRAGKWTVTVAVYQQTQIIAIWPGYKEVAFGIAIDVGSTTIAAHLCDLSSGEVLSSGGIMNPQIRFGEDLMSRVSYVMMQPEGAVEMTSAVRKGINDLISSVTGEIGVVPADVVEISLVANPIMHHLLLGISPVELGVAPFVLATDEALSLPARQLQLEINPGGKVYILPCIAGHVGADTAGVILSEQPHEENSNILLIDIGTNAEIVLGNRQRLLACSSPTGPAFEGAQITYGQRAAPGAIERVRIDPETLCARIKVIGSELWSNEAGFKEAISEFGVTGICGSGIIEAIAEMYLVGIVTRDGVIDGTRASISDRIVADDRTWSYELYKDDASIFISQNDVRQIQLAKAALYAGVKLLMDKMGIDRVSQIRLAGAFGSHIDVKYATVLGLIPDCELSKVTSVGNAAGTGARIALLNLGARDEIESVVHKIEKIETAVETNFQEYFVDAMAIPHKKDPFTNLFSVVPRPEERTSEVLQDSGTRKRRRRI